PVPGPGAAPIPTGGAPIPHGSPSAEIVQADDVEIQRRVRAAGGWAGVSAPDLLRIYRYRTGSLKDGAEQELRNRGLFP
ncbi:MAG TPA: hypothetical protein VFJ84_01355, partial [Candidatus Saccharimonadales bacterium]|nr:hypothetical protein [Candidatus Saccharimonadales bacterium]